MNSRKKRFVNPIKIEVTRRARTETILGKPLQFSMGINLLEPMTHICNMFVSLTMLKFGGFPKKGLMAPTVTHMFIRFGSAFLSARPSLNKVAYVLKFLVNKCGEQILSFLEK